MEVYFLVLEETKRERVNAKNIRKKTKETDSHKNLKTNR